ncbi:MAG: DUF4959 domain-containing protein [Bacteroidales bacterium]|jgi:hypothetical protein|nr:DUF4959 domain-containing protein [Bacteroidales bacterium]
MKTIQSFYRLWMIVAALCVLPSCEEERHAPIQDTDAIPAAVINPVATSLPGAASISYQLPDDKNLLYVKAQAEIKEGVTREVKTSYYANSFVIDGFGDTLLYPVRIYSVGRNNKMSDPVIVPVKPQTPPVFTVYESIAESVQETFGGIKFSIQNPSKADMRIHFATTDTAGKPITETYYTSSVAASYSYKGFDTLPRVFSFYVEDRWGNSSDYFTSTFYPWPETPLDKNKFRAAFLPGDMSQNYTNRPIEKLWDNLLGDANMLHTLTGIQPLPHTITFDLGVKAFLTSVKVIGRSNTATQYMYNAGHPQEWRIFGSTAPNPNGAWDDSWTELRSTPCVSFKPSGLPAGQLTQDDIDYQLAGEEFELNYEVPVRYLRWSVDAVWGGPTIQFFNMTEIWLYGRIVETY